MIKKQGSTPCLQLSGFQAMGGCKQGASFSLWSNTPTRIHECSSRRLMVFGK